MNPELILRQMRNWLIIEHLVFIVFFVVGICTTYAFYVTDYQILYTVSRWFCYVQVLLVVLSGTGIHWRTGTYVDEYYSNSALDRLADDPVEYVKLFIPNNHGWWGMRAMLKILVLAFHNLFVSLLFFNPISKVDYLVRMLLKRVSVRIHDLYCDYVCEHLDTLIRGRDAVWQQVIHGIVWEMELVRQPSLRSINPSQPPAHQRVKFDSDDQTPAE